MGLLTMARELSGLFFCYDTGSVLALGFGLWAGSIG
jgi:hypothetical protein